MSSLLLQLAKLLPDVIHPKVATAAVTSAVATIVLWVLASKGHSAPSEVSAAIVTVVGFVIGYLTPASRTAAVVTTPTASGGSVTKA